MINTNWMSAQLKGSSTAKALNIYHDATKAQKMFMITASFGVTAIATFLLLVMPVIEKREQAINEYKQSLNIHQTYFGEVAPAYTTVPPMMALLQTETVITDLAKSVGLSFKSTMSIEGKGVQITGQNLSFHALTAWLKKLSDLKVSISEYEIRKAGEGVVDISVIAY